MKRLALFTIIVFTSSVIFSQEKSFSLKETPQSKRWVDSVFNQMSLDQKIGQLFMVAAYSNKDKAHSAFLSRLISKNHIGGLIFFKGDPIKQAEMTNKFQRISKLPLFIAIDGEWGLAMRLKNTPKYPRQLTLGAIRDNRMIYRMGNDIADQCNRMGIHINFAPVVDINTNPDNPVINSRSFGENKYNVAFKGLSYALGLQDRGVIATAKHFPGHGDTNTDSHKTLPVISHNRSRLDSIELYPFKTLFNSGVEGVMVAHLNIPALDNTSKNASTLSKKVVTDLLQTELNFKGLIFTDALNMKGVSSYHKPGGLEVMALQAGNDVLLFPEDVPRALNAIKSALKRKKLSKSDVFRKVKKILLAKYNTGNTERKTIEINSLDKDLNKPEYTALISELYENAVTVLKNSGDILPIKDISERRIATLAIGREKAGTFQHMINLYSEIDHIYIKDIKDTAEVAAALKKAYSYDLVICSVHNTSQSAYKKFNIKPEIGNIIRQLSEGPRVIVDLFGNPYGLKYLGDISKVDGLIVSYEDNDMAEDAAAQVIFGGKEATGILPVTTSDYKEGEGIITEKIRLGYSEPKNCGIIADSLARIDSLVLRAIENRGMPGCQIIAAIKGNVFLNKTYGYHTYKKKREVKVTDLYDIASITKVTATIPSLMKLYDDRKFWIDRDLEFYLPELHESNKADLNLRDILTHQSGLKPWINFYLRSMEPLNENEKLISNKLSDTYPLKTWKNMYMNRNYTFKDGYFVHEKSNEFSIEVAPGVYASNSIIDTLYSIINESDLLKKKRYKYSDLGYYYLKQITERLSNKSIDNLTYDYYYKPLGAKRLTYNPLNSFSKSEIVPTENDIIYRRNLLHGYVHDPGAALMGGVAGHAGLFSNANDLAKYAQMLLNKGKYGGKKYLHKNTVSLFTQYQFLENDNRRALGFDKPNPIDRSKGPTCESATTLSFGHSGFTGCLMWIDPVYDLVYIFLSNRVHPDQYNTLIIKENLRTDIQQIVYNSIDKNW
ncbi:MAG: serine hydrolase [Bacteroidales bacterium]|jgi:beta-glucosidase-like glycosyl hydrolase/CubicO group peptidase (beta-lactamase class C family)|nr:serine hydrolase [Bacteroidales bacterium]